MKIQIENYIADIDEGADIGSTMEAISALLIGNGWVPATIISGYEEEAKRLQHVVNISYKEDTNEDSGD